MTDVISKHARSRLMSSIRSIGTKPELMLRLRLRKHGFSYQPKMPFSPDFANRSKRIVIFVDGCFWHLCPEHREVPMSNRKYWLQKLRRNKIRDSEANLAYKTAGWRVLRIWEHDIS